MTDEIIEQLNSILINYPLPKMADTLSAGKSGVDMTMMVFSSLVSHNPHMYEVRCITPIEIIIKNIIEHGSVFSGMVTNKLFANRLINTEASITDFRQYFSSLSRALDNSNYYDIALVGIISSHLAYLYSYKYPEPDSKYYIHIVRKIIDLRIKAGIKGLRYHDTKNNWSIDPARSKIVVRDLFKQLNEIDIYDDNEWVAHMIHITRLLFITLGVMYLPSNKFNSEIISIYKISNMTTKIKGVGW